MQDLKKNYEVCYQTSFLLTSWYLESSLLMETLGSVATAANISEALLDFV